MKTTPVTLCLFLISFGACKKDYTTRTAIVDNVSTVNAAEANSSTLFVAGLHTINAINTVTGLVADMPQFDVNATGISETPLYYRNNLIILAGKELVSKTYPSGVTNWSLLLNEQSQAAYTTSALCMAGNTIFFSMHFRTSGLSGSVRLYAVNANTGKIKWKQLIKLNPYNNYTTPNINTPDKLSPTVANNVVYFPSSDTLYAYTTDGNLLWKYRTQSSNATDNYGHHFNPVAVNGVVYFAAGTATDAATKDSLFAVNAATGTLVWKKPFNMGPDAAFVYNNDKLYINGSNGVYCLNPSNGAEIWKYQVRAFSVSPFVVIDSAVYTSVQTHSKVYSLNATTGSLIWNVDNYKDYLDFNIDDGIIASGDKVFVGTKNNLVRAFDAFSGSLLWESMLTFTQSSSTPRIPVFLLQADNTVLYSAESGMN